ncbi:leukotriene-A4 hydrolase [Cantharellus anzutake]|uniref:leukotriene-A4 hydrolase n=1 Tax=Cantharellus anzutake TaxID=1750568 RepID=UPI00190609B6|nr:leukotriene-A4 hydrolase [Cantharellus anzutake]KAF8329109.1 leukotriene-A4 hydrolase [Cantharellus anzutake]
MALDPTTHSNYLDISTKHVHFDWKILWGEKKFVGSATHDLVVHKDGVGHVIFDTSYLNITDVKIGHKSTKFALGERHPVVGSPLTVYFPSTLSKGDTIKVTIDYNTTGQGTAVGWLDKEQTAGKHFPYLFSQCQPIYARCMAPLQDTPSLKITYSSRVTSVLPVLMSALRLSPPAEEVHGGKEVGKDEVTYEYNQPVAIPSYIIAIASGNVVYKPFSSSSVAGQATEPVKWKTGLWTEPEVIDAAYWEFEKDTARYVHEAEKIITPYDFGVYDLLVLPPSFPYGGMENSCLTFVTPSKSSSIWGTLLAGDRSLVDVVGHEISHSWFGNNVTTADAGHFWLNEGWTTWLERVLQGALHGPAERDFSYIIGRKALDEALKEFQDRPKYQRLLIPFEFGEDPDEAYSSVPYEKGSNFLLYLERLLGGLDVFLPYARDYVRMYRGKSIRTDQWKEHLYQYWSRKENGGGEDKIKTLDSVDWDAWLHGEGLSLPADIPYDTTLANDAYLLAARWNESKNHDISKLDFNHEDLDSFNSNQKVVFLERLATLAGPSSLPPSHIHYLAETYLDAITNTSNPEIRLRFYNFVLAASPDAARKYTPDAAAWLVEKQAPGLKGRMKFCRPIFRAIGKVDMPLARKTFKENEIYFHPIARRLIEKVMPLRCRVRERDD